MENRSRFKSLVEDMDEVCNRIYLYEDILKRYDEEYLTLKDNLEKNIADLRALFDVHIVNERMLYTIENNFIQEQVDKMNSNLNEYKEITDKTIEEMKTDTKINFDNVNERINNLNKDINSIEENNIELKEDVKNKTDNIEVKQIMFEMESRIDSDIIMDLIQRSKNTEFSFGQQLKLHDEDIQKSKNDISQNKNTITQIQNDITRLDTALDTSGNQLTEQIENIKNRAKEAEREDGVQRTLEKIINNVETIVERENLMTLTEGNESNFLKKFEQIEKISNDNQNTIKELKKKVDKLNEEGEKTKKASELEVKQITDQILNNIEFNNIYNILNSGKLLKKKLSDENIGKNDNILDKEENDIIDNKINNALEKIKNDNINMWENSVKLTQRVDELGNIREIINNIPPVIYPKNESLRRLLDVDYYENQNPVPVVPDLFSRLKLIYQNEGNENNNNEDGNNVQIQNNVQNNEDLI